MSQELTSIVPPEPPIPDKKDKRKIIAAVFLVIGFIFLGIINIFISRRDFIFKQKEETKNSTIKIAVNPWKASELNAAIAKIILEEEMGYSVELVAIDENTQWQSLSDGVLHATLEVWPSGHKQNIEKYIQEQKSVEDAGLLGPVGKIGWFVPKYLQVAYPQLLSWEGFKDPKITALFASQPGSKGQFFTGDPTWTQYDSQIIKNLGLDLEVKVLGSEESLIQAIDTAYNDKKPIIFYFWTPHWAHSIYDLAPVLLPSYSEACYEEPSTIDCDYPEDKLLKAFWSDFKNYAPKAYTFLKKFNYTNQDQIGMLAAVQLEKKSVEDVARIWVRNNEAIWRPWIE